jgi:formylglycine-generating enzyme required for sulfatase activity
MKSNYRPRTFVALPALLLIASNCSNSTGATGATADAHAPGQASAGSGGMDAGVNSHPQGGSGGGVDSGQPNVRDAAQDRGGGGGGGGGKSVDAGLGADAGLGGDGNAPVACPSGMVPIPSKNQSFLMGFTAAEAGTEWACFIGQHKVTFTYDFCMDANLVTQGDYSKLMGNNPSSHKGPDTLPVDAVTWFDALLYCNERSKQEGLDPAYSFTSSTRSGNHVTGMVGLSYDIKKNGYRLPTNAEYEYAERANLTDYTYFFSKTATANINTAASPASAYSWNTYNSSNTTHPVGTKKPNPWGLYDIVGNLFEWENDWEGPYLTTDQVDPTGPANGDAYCGTDNVQTQKRMAKGGAYAQDVENHERISYHYKFFPTSVDSQIGFRCVVTVE